MAIGDKILTIRKEKGWGPQQLAKKIGTSGPIIGRYESGEMVPSAEVVKKMVDTFDKTLDTYFILPVSSQILKLRRFLTGYLRLKSLIRRAKKQLCM